MVPIDRLQRILIEEATHPGAAHPSDTPEERDVRACLRDEIAEIRRTGGAVEIPSDIEA